MSSSKADLQGECYAHYTDRLLVLPESDLKMGKADLVLCTVPLEALQRRHPTEKTATSQQLSGPCLIANDKSACLISVDDRSYSLTTVGTSNTLVVWNPSTAGAPDGSISAPSPKKQKTTNGNSPNPCRLIQPGGSGASFLDAKVKTITKEQVQNLLIDSNRASPLSTLQLALKLQCSKGQVEAVLSRLPCIGALEDSKDSSQKTWSILAEEDIWQAQAAVVQALCEEGTDSDAADMSSHVEKRLVGVLSDQVPTFQYGQVARKFLHLASDPDNSTTGSLKPETIVRWVAQDLFRERATWSPISDYVETCQSRLPLEDAYQTLVPSSLSTKPGFMQEWLQEYQLPTVQADVEEDQLYLSKP